MSATNSVWKRSFLPVLFTYFIDNFGLAIVYPIFTPLFLTPKYALLTPDFTFFHKTFLLGLLIASFPLAQFFGAPLIGELSDRFGRKKIFTITICGTMVGYFVTGIGIHLHTLPLLWAGRTLTGFFAGNLTICLASVADITQEKDRARNFGWVATIGGLGFICAILVGGTLSHYLLPEAPFFLTAFLSLLNLLLLLAFFKESHPTSPHDKLVFFKGLEHIGKAIRTGNIRALYLSYFLFMLCWVASMQFLTTYLIEAFQASIGLTTLVFLFIGCAWSFANFILNPRLSTLLSPSKTFLFSLIGLSFFLFLSFVSPFLGFIVFFLLATLCAAIAWTNGLATISISVAKTIQGSILGINQSIVATASILAPILGGMIAGIDLHKLYLLTALCSALSALLYFIHTSEIKKS